MDLLNQSLEDYPIQGISIWKLSRQGPRLIHQTHVKKIVEIPNLKEQDEN